MRNEQIVNWFEDLIPEIKKSGNPHDVFLKFAGDKNLSPALLEKLGHVYNTAKTVNYLDKSASTKRGSTFKILDVPELLEAYQKKASAGHKYDNYGFEEKRISSDLFSLDTPFTVKEVPASDYMEVKAASDLSKKFKKAAANEVNTRNYSQLKFELTEDLRELTSKFASELRATSVEFQDIERDANYYFEGAAKEACDFLAKNMESLHVPIKRASDNGPERVIEDYKTLNMVGQTQKLLCDLAVVNGDQFKSAHVEVEEEKPASQIDQFFFQKEANSAAQKGVTPKGTSTQTSSKGDVDNSKYINTGEAPPVSRAEGGDSKIMSSLNDAFGAMLGGAGKGISSVKDLYESKNTDQEMVDIGQQEVEHAAILQNLLNTDEILSEEDPEKVIEAYNTFRKLAPGLASDMNVARVTLRSMIQHDGVSVFDANQFSRAENDKQKVDNNIRARERLDYGTSGDKSRTKVQLS